MISAVLWLALLWSPAAHVLITPGMTREQVEAIMGQSGYGIIIAGAASDPSITCFYEHITVYYHDGKVEKVSHRRK